MEALINSFWVLVPFTTKGHPWRALGKQKVQTIRDSEAVSGLAFVTTVSTPVFKKLL